jgi:hypothetical protein
MATLVRHMDYMSTRTSTGAASAVRRRTMAGDPEWRKKVSERAHAIWEREGRPYGRAGAHWIAAEAELLSEEARRNRLS